MTMPWCKMVYPLASRKKKLTGEQPIALSNLPAHKDSDSDDGDDGDDEKAKTSKTKAKGKNKKVGSRGQMSANQLALCESLWCCSGQKGCGGVDGYNSFECLSLLLVAHAGLQLLRMPTLQDPPSQHPKIIKIAQASGSKCSKLHLLATVACHQPSRKAALIIIQLESIRHTRNIVHKEC